MSSRSLLTGSLSESAELDRAADPGPRLGRASHRAADPPAVGGRHVEVRLPHLRVAPLRRRYGVRVAVELRTLTPVEAAVRPLPFRHLRSNGASISTAVFFVLFCLFVCLIVCLLFLCFFLCVCLFVCLILVTGLIIKRLWFEILIRWYLLLGDASERRAVGGVGAHRGRHAVAVAAAPARHRRHDAAELGAVGAAQVEVAVDDMVRQRRAAVRAAEAGAVCGRHLQVGGRHLRRLGAAARALAVVVTEDGHYQRNARVPTVCDE